MLRPSHNHPLLSWWRYPESRLLGVSLLLGLLAGAATLLYNGVFEWFVHHLIAGIVGIDIEAIPLVGNLWTSLGLAALKLPLLTAAGVVAVAGFVRATLGSDADHSTDRVIEAFHRHGGDLPKRIAWVVAVASILTVASGGAAGREAQGALIGAAIGAAVGRWLATTTQQRRIIMLIGMSAGLSAMFKSPVGAAFMAIEILYRGIHFESEAILYTLAAAVVGYVLAGSMTGWTPLFPLPRDVQVTSALHYGGVAGVGLIAGLFAAVFPTVFYRIAAAVAAIPLPWWLKAALGGGLVGGIGIFVPQILGDSTSLLDAIVTQPAPLGHLVALGFLKVVLVAITLSAGGVGGILAPSLFIGASIGAASASITGLPLAPLALVGMAAFLAGVVRVPVATLLMVPELTGDFLMLPPTALAVAISYLVQLIVAERMPYPSIHRKQPGDIFSSPAHEEEVLEAGIGLLKRGGISLPEGLDLPDLRALLGLGYPIRLGQGDLILLTAALAPASQAAGATLRQAPFGAGVLLLEIRRGTQVIAPTPDTALAAGDNMVLLTSLSHLGNLRSHLDFPAVFLNWLKRHEPQTYAEQFGEAEEAQ